MKNTNKTAQEIINQVTKEDARREGLKNLLYPVIEDKQKIADRNITIILKVMKGGINK